MYVDKKHKKDETHPATEVKKLLTWNNSSQWTLRANKLKLNIFGKSISPLDGEYIWLKWWNGSLKVYPMRQTKIT